MLVSCLKVWECAGFGDSELKSHWDGDITDAFRLVSVGVCPSAGVKGQGCRERPGQRKPGREGLEKERRAGEQLTSPVQRNVSGTWSTTRARTRIRKRIGRMRRWGKGVWQMQRRRGRMRW